LYNIIHFIHLFRQKEEENRRNKMAALAAVKAAKAAITANVPVETKYSPPITPKTVINLTNDDKAYPSKDM